MFDSPKWRRGRRVIFYHVTGKQRLNNDIKMKVFNNKHCLFLYALCVQAIYNNV